LDELCAEAHSNIGVVLSDMGLLQEALESFNQALKVDRDNPSILANYINLKSALCSWDDREYDLSRLLDMLRYQLMDDRGQLQLSTTRGGSFSDRSGNYWRSAQFASKVTLPALQPYHALRYPLSPLELLQVHILPLFNI
jgi:tetratricopeptide (TPR) repeat protein